jgi:phenol 2-monooxygenase (NADPH)
MAPYKVDFASQLSWFAVWKVNERVARNFSSPDQRVHIGGDAG